MLMASYDLGGGWRIAAGGRQFRTTVHTRSYVTAPAPGQSRAAYTADALSALMNLG
mgnify:CR=1 FL=1